MNSAKRTHYDAVTEEQYPGPAIDRVAARRADALVAQPPLRPHEPPFDTSHLDRPCLTHGHPGQLSVNASGYAFGQGGAQVPIERAGRRMWSTPVVVSNSVPVGTGYLFDAGSVELRIRQEAEVHFSEHIYSPDRFGPGQGGTLFEANQVQFRCELRAGVGREATCGHRGNRPDRPDPLIVR